ncbi:hypothetical protein [Cryptosporangium aurantiacum]|uniref:Uncharacterized protein n=1 Tax=Cryptosporangium aurantiacum TaxID=134849 RepID=A0A1M7RB28_9ACTN|nr:hypothetical protein [Cryptosporangium aurantiacum]SHN43497.1 hypothetical protein SAMN05443668_109198 [Cryptosporangium aurantiacum]
MNATIFLSLHVLAAILTIGPVTVAASMFPRYLRAAAEDPHAVTILGALHRICRVYTVIGLTVPAFGLATAAALGVLTDAWLLTSIVLTAIAAGVLCLVVLPQQAAALGGYTTSGAAGSPSTGGAADTRAAARLGAATGVFNLLWAVVVVLMIVRPGSTTGV